MNDTATEAKSRLDQRVFVEKSGRRHSVVRSVRPCDAWLHKRPGGLAADVGHLFCAQHREWVDAQNCHVDQHGVFGEEFRAW